MIPNLETLSGVSGASLWLREMATDFAGKQLSHIERKQGTLRLHDHGTEVKSPLTEKLEQCLVNGLSKKLGT